ncbi:secreted protein [Beggiatoa sp. PS]|nr:secreted protein [Beggiatoa sp. PS]
MNFKKTLFLATMLISGSLFAIPVLAGGTFVNDKGYEVSITGHGYEATYYGCTPKKRNRKRNCLYLEEPETAEGNYFEWNNKGHRYEMEPLNRYATKYRLKIYSPKGKVILNQVLWEDD